MTHSPDVERFATQDELLALHTQGTEWLNVHGVPLDGEVLGYAPNGLPIHTNVPGFEARLSGRRTRSLAAEAAGTLGVGSHVRLWSSYPSYEPRDLLFEEPIGSTWLYFDVHHTRKFSPIYSFTAYTVGYDEDGTYGHFETTRRNNVSTLPGSTWKDLVTCFRTGSDLITLSQFSDLQTIMNAWQQFSSGRSRKSRW